VGQEEIRLAVPQQAACLAFRLALSWGRYDLAYTRTGSHLLLAGSRGHVALLNWRDKDLVLERNLEEKVRCGVFLQHEGLFALAQKKHVFIYDRDGVMLHRLEQTLEPEFLEYLDYHYLLVALSRLGFMTFQDISTGQAVAHYRLKGSEFRAMCQNVQNGVVALGDGGGRVHFHTPNTSEPLVKLLAHQGAVSSVAMRGNTLVTAGNEGKVKLYDIRTFRELHSWGRRPAAANLAISDNGLLAMSCGSVV
jgi:U3 small nucleolar RNA-associated protein 7